jgi:outer membrane protein assembly factor BamB
LRIDAQTGQVEWTRRVSGSPEQPATAPRSTPEKRGSQKFHRDHNLASPSPVTDGQTVVVHFGNGDLAAYDFDGRQLWFRNLQEDYGKYTIWWGHANSPVIHRDLVISVCMQDSCRDLQSPPAPSYLVAHDLRTGRERWKTMRMTDATMEHCDSYTTPIFRQSPDRLEMIVMGGEVLDAYDPANGQRLWWVDAVQGNRVIPTPVAARGMIFAVRGMRGPLVAVRPQGDGPRGEEEVVWEFDQSTSDSPSPVVAGDLLLMVSNNGIAQCFEVSRGERLWRERLPGEYRASPIVADGRVYFQNRDGLTTVISASRQFEKLAENRVDDETIASPAVSDQRLFLRGRQWLYCIEG